MNATAATPNPTNDATARLLRHINARRRKRGWAWWVLALAAVAAAGFGWLAWSYPARFPGLVPPAQLGLFQAMVGGMGLVVLAAGAIIARQMARAQWVPKAAFVSYKMDETAYRLYLGLQYELESLGRVQTAWRYVETQNPEGPRARSRIRVRGVPLADIRVQLPVRGVGLPWLSLFFLPTQVLLLQKGRYQSIAYASLSATAKLLTSDPPAAGAAQVVSGLGRLTIKSGKTLLFDIQVSNFDVARDFVAALTRYREYLAAPKPPEPPPQAAPPPRPEREANRPYPRAETYRPYTPPPPPPPRPPVLTPALNPYEVLGLRPGATAKEITAAYRTMAKLYHPDHTHALGPDIRAAAERKMKEINAAYAELKP